jgi:hypothetical protein
LRSINYIIAIGFAFISCEILEPVYDNTLDLDNNAPPALLFTPETSTTTLGGSAAVMLYALEVENIAGVRARIQYDAAKLIVSTVSAGSFFTGSQAPVFIYDDNGSGTLDIYSFYMGSDRIKTGTGDIALIVFSTKLPGNASIELTTESELLDQNGELIPIQSFGRGVISAQ